MGFFKRQASTMKRAVASDQHKANIGAIEGMLRKLFSRPKVKPNDTFEGLSEMGIDTQQIEEAKVTFTRLLILFLILAFLVIVYVVILFAHGETVVGVVGLCVWLALLAQAFKYHFWLFQIKRKKLGCTFKEWLLHVLHIER